VEEKHVAEKISATQRVYAAARKIYGLYIPLLEARFHFSVKNFNTHLLHVNSKFLLWLKLIGCHML